MFELLAVAAVSTFTDVEIVVAVSEAASSISASGKTSVWRKTSKQVSLIFLQLVVLVMQEAKYDIFRDCLGFRDLKNFDGVRFSFKGIRIVTFKLKEQIDVDQLINWMKTFDNDLPIVSSDKIKIALINLLF